MSRSNFPRDVDGESTPQSDAALGRLFAKGFLAIIATAFALVGLLLAVLPAHAAVPSAGAAPVAPTLPTGPVETAAELLLLGVRINGIEHPKGVNAVRLPKGLAVPRDTWADWQLKPATGAPIGIEGTVYQLLQDEHGLRWRIDEASQTLVIDAPAASFTGGRYAVASDAAPAVIEPTLGGYANYDLQAQNSRFAGHDTQTASGFLEAGAFYKGGYGGTTALVRHDPNATRWLRLDTGWNIDRPEDMTSLRIGDSVSRSGTWGRSLRYGGVQWGTNFATRPGFMSFPLPTLRGEAALPSTLDLFINNSQRYQSTLPPGPFELSNLPIVTGQGQIRMVVKDVLGREQEVVQPYYVSPALLRPGLSSRAIDFGVVRENYGLNSNEYSRVMLSAIDREGITEHFTREWRAEAMGSQQTLGAAGVWALPAFGTVNASLAYGRSEHDSGAMLTTGAEHQAAAWSGSVQLRTAQRGFIQQGQSLDNSPHLSVAVAFGTTIGRGSVGTSFIKQTTWQGERVELVSASYGRDLGRLGYLGVFALRDLNRPNGTSLGLSFTFALDPYTSASVNATRTRDDVGKTRNTSLQLQRNLPAGPGFGYQINAEHGSTDRYQALGSWQTETALFQGGIARSGDMADARVGVAGGVAWVGNSVLLSRRIEGSFAVVEVSDYPGVQVLHDNQPVARTDANGRALLTGLRGFQRNRISVDATALPFDAEVDALEVMLTPGMRSGAQVTFPVQRAQAATFRLVQADGAAVPAGSSVQVAGRQRSFPVGFDGKGFASGLATDSRLIARWPGHECHARAAIATADDEVPELGTLVCSEAP